MDRLLVVLPSESGRILLWQVAACLAGARSQLITVMLPLNSRCAWICDLGNTDLKGTARRAPGSVRWSRFFDTDERQNHLPFDRKLSEFSYFTNSGVVLDGKLWLEFDSQTKIDGLICRKKLRGTLG
ncbi:hypothetical protein V8E36_000731 [Tilletia maclaganii]